MLEKRPEVGTEVDLYFPEKSPPASLFNISGPVHDSVKAARNIRVINHNIQTVFPASNDKLLLDGPRYRVVHALIDPRPHITSLLANCCNFCNLESGIIAQPQGFECTSLIGLVDCFERNIEWDGTVGGM